MTAAFCRAAADRKAATWDEQLASFTRLEFAVSDAAKGIAAAVAQRAAARRDDPSAPPLEHGLDVFHTAMEANRVLARHWRRAEAVWEKAEGADAEVAGAKRQGIDARGPARAAGAAWWRAIAAFEEADARPQAAVLELPAVPLRAAEGRLPLPGLGAGVAHLRLLGVAPRRPGPVDATTVNAGNCRLRQSLPVWSPS
jgi:hypothetical protein